MVFPMAPTETRPQTQAQTIASLKRGYERHQAEHAARADAQAARLRIIAELTQHRGASIAEVGRRLGYSSTEAVAKVLRPFLAEGDTTYHVTYGEDVVTTAELWKLLLKTDRDIDRHETKAKDAYTSRVVPAASTLATEHGMSLVQVARLIGAPRDSLRSGVYAYWAQHDIAPPRQGRPRRW